jgi:hypothetical protein
MYWTYHSLATWSEALEASVYILQWQDYAAGFLDEYFYIPTPDTEATFFTLDLPFIRLWFTFMGEVYHVCKGLIWTVHQYTTATSFYVLQWQDYKSDVDVVCVCACVCMCEGMLIPVQVCRGFICYSTFLLFPPPHLIELFSITQ